MCTLHHFSKAIGLIALLGISRGVWAQEDYQGWNLESSVNQAHLVMVARVVKITRVTVVEGAKTDVALREFRFQPMRKLKGLFQREELSMTASDLGISGESASSTPPLKEGEFRLLILTQQQGGAALGGIQSFGCVAPASGATTFDQRVPLVTGPDDPLVGAVETLIRVADSRSRSERATLLVDRLADVDGRAAVLLLSSLQPRADWAAEDDRAYAALARLARDPLSAAREAALDVLRDTLASHVAPTSDKQLDAVAGALRDILESNEPITRVRVSALQALGYLLALKADYHWPRELLIAQLAGAASYGERSAAATALSHLAHPDAVRAVLDALAGLPLDEDPTREAVYARAAVRLDPAGAERVLLARLERSIAARQSLEAEIDPLARLRSKESLPVLLAIAGRSRVTPGDRYHIAAAFGRLGDDRAAPVLASWLREGDFQLKESALAALETLDSDAAAAEVRPLLKSEPYLPYKLRLARLLARHQVGDGYALATEHLADAEQTAPAALVLAALKDPRTTSELSAILAARPDRRWHAAALAGLAAVGDAAARGQLLQILSDDRHALAADAATAAGLTDDGELLAPLAKLAQSRNRQISLSALIALRRSLSGVRSAPRGLAVETAGDADATAVHRADGLAPAADLSADTRAAIFKSVAALAGDAYVEPDVRLEAFAVARLLRGEGYAKLLAELDDQAELEGAPLLAQVQAERRRARD